MRLLLSLGIVVVFCLAAFGLGAILGLWSVE